jgi:uncharacterized protein (TIGR04255 family)
MVLSVPDPPRFRMQRAPLLQALVQVNFPVVARVETLSGVAPLQDALADLFPYMNRKRVQEVSLLVGPAGPATPERAESWINEFTDDEGWTLSVTSTSASLSVGSDYAGVQDFARRFTTVCEALRDAARVRRCDRIGVRYLDAVYTSTAPTEWASWFRPEIIGLAHPDIAPREHLLASITETRLRRPAEGIFAWAANTPVEGIIRHGLVPAGSLLMGMPPRPVAEPSFLLDMDMFMAAPQPFEPDALSAQYLELHTDIERIFHWTVTESGKKQFGYELEDEGSG